MFVIDKKHLLLLMSWNWQQADWPHFTYSAMRLDDFEKRLHQRSVNQQLSLP
jgi:hypothetical protein